MKIKKQYLISLLGIAMIAIPLGTSLNNKPSLNNSSFSNSENAGEITLSDSSLVTVFDTSKTGDEYNYDNITSDGDQLESIQIEAYYNPLYNNGDAVIITDEWKDNLNIYVYNSSKIEIFKTSYSFLESIDGGEYIPYEIENTGGTFTLSLNSVDNPRKANSKLANIWAYEISENDTNFEIKIKSKTIDNLDSVETSIGKVEISDDVINLTNSATKVETTDNIPKISEENGSITASIDYVITPVLNVYGKNEPETEIKSIEWWDLGADGKAGGDKDTIIKSAPNNDLTGTIERDDIESGEVYNKSEIRVETIENGLSPSVVTPSSTLDKYWLVGAPEKDTELEHIYTDENNTEILSIEGKIDSNGSMIQSVSIIDTNLTGDNGEELKSEEQIVGTSELINKNGFINDNLEPIEYEVHINNYDQDLSHYQIVIAYEDENGELEYSEGQALSGNAGIEGNEDLSGYLISAPEKDKLGATAITAIVVGSIVLFVIIAWLSRKIYKKYKEGNA